METTVSVSWHVLLSRKEFRWLEAKQVIHAGGLGKAIQQYGKYPRLSLHQVREVSK